MTAQNLYYVTPDAEYFIKSAFNPLICSGKKKNQKKKPKNFDTIRACTANICIDVNPAILLNKALGGLGSVN